LLEKIKKLPYFNDLLKVLLTLLLCLPLLFINIRNDIDWGDDNSHYLLQAKYISEGTPQANTQYIYNSNCPVLGPAAYPVGFPLMLSVVYFFKGLNLHAFSLVLTMALIALCFMMVLFYRKTHHFITSVFLVLIIAYNPWTLNFKSEIMSEIPFTVILLFTLLLYGKFKNIYSFIFVGLLCGYLISIRTIGVVLPLGILAETTRNSIIAIKRKETTYGETAKKVLINIGMIFSSCFGLYFLLNYVVFKIPSDPASGYLSIFSLQNLDAIFLKNLANYTETLKYFFNPHNNKWIFLPLITKSFVFTMILLGFIKKMFRNAGVSDFFVVMYMLVLLVYPYNNSGFRFLFPLLPFFMSYAVIGLKSIHLGFTLKTPAKAILLGSLVLVQYIYGINEIKRSESVIQEGPCVADSWAVFDYIKNQTPPDAVIAFVKPRALVLFTNRKCITNNSDQTETATFIRKFDEVGVTYYLLYCQKPDEPSGGLLSEMINLPLQKYIDASPGEISLCWSNQRFKLYKKTGSK